MMKFKVGDKVRLNQHTCTEEALYDYASSGEFNVVYIIEAIEECYSQVCLKGNNLHKLEWLIKVIEEPLIGGELV